MYNNFSGKNDKRFFPKNNCNSNQKITKKSCYNHMNQEETICPRGPARANGTNENERSNWT